MDDAIASFILDHALSISNPFQTCPWLLGSSLAQCPLLTHTDTQLQGNFGEGCKSIACEDFYRAMEVTLERLGRDLCVG